MIDTGRGHVRLLGSRRILLFVLSSLATLSRRVVRFFQNLRGPRGANRIRNPGPARLDRGVPSAAVGVDPCIGRAETDVRDPAHAIIGNRGTLLLKEVERIWVDPDRYPLRVPQLLQEFVDAGYSRAGARSRSPRRIGPP